MALDAVYDSGQHQYQCDVARDQGGFLKNKNDDPIAEEAHMFDANASDLHDVIATILDNRSSATVAVQSKPGQRSAKRVSWQAPLDLGAAKGVMRDISASGAYFETVDTYPFSSSTSFEVDIDMSDSHMRLRYIGEIVRLELRHKKVGVAVRLIEASIEAR